MYTKISDLKAMPKTAEPKGQANVIAPEKNNYLPLFVPMGSPKPRGGAKPGDTPETNPALMYCKGQIVPVHTTCMQTRGDAIHELLDSSMRSGNVGAIYNAYFYTIVSVLATAYFATIGSNVYIAAACAYASGHFWSERLLNSAWSISWFKGKTVTYTP